MERKENVFFLDKSDVESAVMQFICSCHPDIAIGYTISVYNQSGCQAIAHDGKKGCGILELTETCHICHGEGRVSIGGQCDAKCLGCDGTGIISG